MTQWDSGYTGAGDPAAPAGWYPVDGGLQRYWDGAAWTEHTAPLAAPPKPPAVPPTAQPNLPPAAQSYGAPDAPTPWVDGRPAGQSEATSAAAPPFQQSLHQPFAAPPAGAPYRAVPAVDGAHYAPPASSDDRTFALLLHLSTLVSGFIGPLILWLVKRDESSFIDYHGKEALNFQISLFLYWIVAVMGMLVLIGIFLIPVLLILQIVMPIVAGIEANRGRHYRYPLTLRVIT